MNISALIISTSLFLLTMVLETGSELNDKVSEVGTEITIIDFSSTSGASWQIVNDSVMGGISRSTLQLQDGGYALFSGTVSLENSGGFASVRTRARTPADLSDFEGLSVRVLGDGKIYSIRVKTVKNGRITRYSYEARFNTVAGEWQTYKLPFSEFKPVFRGRDVRGNPEINSDAIIELGFMIQDGQEGPFRMGVRSIGVYR